MDRPPRRAPLDRRIPGETPTRLSGPAAGGALVRTAADPTGRAVRGTLYDCAGDKTPWGTVLTCEENVHEHLSFNDQVADERVARGGRALRPRRRPRRLPLDRLRSALPLSTAGATRTRNEAQRFGGVVEVDPHDPSSTPVERTALGRLAHEDATTGLAADGRIVVYTGDDDEHESVYKLVSARPWAPRSSGADGVGDLLDHGTLHVARFEADGTGRGCRSWVADRSRAGARPTP